MNELTQVNDEPTNVAHRIVTHVAVPRGERERRCTFSIKKVVKEVINPQQIRQMMESDFSERSSEVQSLSMDGNKFLEQLEYGIHQTDNGHYEMPLPFREKFPKLPNNKRLALHRLESARSVWERTSDTVSTMLHS